MRTPAHYNLTIYKGNDFKEKLSFQDDAGGAIDLTDWTIKSQVRVARERTAALILGFTIDIPTPSNGEVFLKLTDTETGAISNDKGFYDLLLTDPSDFDEIYVIGEVTFEPTVTTK